MKVIEELYEVVLNRKADPKEGSYTCYLFSKGLDKILKKVGEECAETIVAAKNGDNSELTLEICDVIYHLMVLMVEAGLPLSDIEAELTNRREKIGNLKTIHSSDHNT